MATSQAVLLPNNVRPLRYAIHLTPDLDAFTFDGEESVDVEVLDATDTIVLNACEMTVHAASLMDAGNAEVNAVGIEFDDDDETVSLRFPATVQPGPAVLRISFTGELNDRLTGFYRSSYTREDGTSRTMATTQFEPSSARRAFPCWDEPAMKASFQVTMTVPADMDTISNMPPVEETVDGAAKTVRFAESPVMSTYLLAFVVAELATIEQEAVNGTMVRVITTRGKEEQGRFALETSVALLTYFNDYFGIPYPLEKLDHIAIPDFAAGAMENWGAITYRETALLVDPAISPAATRQRVAEVVSHEMAHMWFGDLVTMQWWDDLWLNESFASWMGDKAVNHIHPEWKMWTQFVANDTIRAFHLDGLRNSHPIEATVRTPAEVEELFDAISYSKGASTIRMLEHYLSEETFRDGLRRYLDAHQYGNARTADLWLALEEASGKPVKALMDTWTGQMGYPVLTVESRHDPDGLKLDVSQSRFLLSHVAEDEGDDESSWKVPVNVEASWEGGSAASLMEAREDTLVLPPPPSAEGSWFKVNAGQTGFYRVNMSPRDWDALIPAVTSRALSDTDRLGLQNDAYALSRAGYLPISQFLAIAEGYRGETDASVWRDLAGNLGDLDTLLSDEDCYPAFKALCQGLFSPLAERMGWQPKPGDGHLDAILRSVALGQAGYFEDPAVLAEARGRFDDYLADPSTLPADLRGVVFSLTAQQGDADTYGKLWELQKSAELQEEKVRLLLALTRIPDPELISDVLQRSLTDDVRSQDTVSVVGAVSANPKGKALAWDFLKDNWDTFMERYGHGGFMLMRLVGLPRGFTTRERLEEVREFYETHPAPAAERSVRQTIEGLELNVAWLERNKEDVAAWFANR
ncbi:MAG: M1 family metallopeptidase [Chloroflexota bacterium]|nr:M1 family metallopeptidase [Chloroflexota bacterium]